MSGLWKRKGRRKEVTRGGQDYGINGEETYERGGMPQTTTRRAESDLMKLLYRNVDR